MDVQIHQWQIIGSLHQSRSSRDMHNTIGSWGRLEFVATPCNCESLEPKGAQADLLMNENTRAKDRSSKMQGRRTGTKERAGDSEAKSAICVINERGKGPNTMSSKEEIGQTVKSSAKIVITTVENDESCTVG